MCFLLFNVRDSKLTKPLALSGQEKLRLPLRKVSKYVRNVHDHVKRLFLVKQFFDVVRLQVVAKLVETTHKSKFVFLECHHAPKKVLIFD